MNTPPANVVGTLEEGFASKMFTTRTLTMSHFSSDKAASSLKLAAGCHSFPCSSMYRTSFRLAVKRNIFRSGAGREMGSISLHLALLLFITLHLVSHVFRHNVIERCAWTLL